MIRIGKHARQLCQRSLTWHLDNQGAKGRKLLKALTNKYTPCAEQQSSRRENSDTMRCHMLSLKIIKIPKIMSKRKIEVGHFADN